MTFILLLILYLLMSNPKIISSEIVAATDLWWQVLVPTMYPSFVVIDMLGQMPLIDRFSRLIFPVFKGLFKINSTKSAFIILVSLICGAPASTKLIQTAYENQEISEKEQENLICAFSSLSMPYLIFILSRHQISILLFYLLYVLLAILWMQLFNKKETPLQSKEINEQQYLKIFLKSIKNNTQILIQILGILIIFRVLISLIFKNEPVFYPYFEILGGLNHCNHPLILLSSLGFLGFSLHLQILSITDHLKYSKFLLSRIYFSLLGILAFL